ncbi:sulfatase [candidate division KSB1 bacterium]|nr:sulfatase [candidate division KSB1 bacterium]
MRCSRRKFLSRMKAGASAMAGISLFSVCSGPQKPNILVLLTDDQRWDTLKSTGNPQIQTPNMDRLAQQGVLFHKAFVTTSICMTSRASIFLGQYLRRHGINDFNTDFRSEQLALSYPMQFKKHGYRTGSIGKYGVGANLPETAYDFWRGVPGQPKYETQDEQGNPIHSTRLFGHQVLDFLRSQPADRPFCLSVSFKAPHVQDGDPRQFISDPAYDGMYKDVFIPPPETATEAHYAAQADFLRGEHLTTRKRWQLRFSNPDLYQKMVKGYYRLISGVDRVIGDIRAELDRLGMAENTIIVLLGDNGFFLGEKGFAGKWYGYEESIRIPLVIYDPRMPEGHGRHVEEKMILNIDVAPTLLELAGFAPPVAYQGRSLVPLMRGKETSWRTDFLYEHLFLIPEQSQEEAGIIPRSVGVRTERYKYLRYIDEEPVYEELYDLEIDPREENNLVKSEKTADILKKLRYRCDKLMEENR